MSVIRSVLAVLAGFIAMAAGVMAFFAVAFGDPTGDVTTSFMLLAALWGLCMAVAGGFLTATLAASSAMKHAIALTVFVGVMSIVSMLGSSGQEPMRFQMANLVAGVAGVCLGGRLQVARTLQTQ